MRTRTKFAVATLAASGALAVGAPVAAQADLISILEGNNVAANVCDTNVNAVLASQDDQDKTNCKNQINDRGNGDNGDNSDLGDSLDLGL